MVGVPLHNILYPIIPIMDYLRGSLVLPYLILHSLLMFLWSSNVSSSFNFNLHMFQHQVFIICPHHTPCGGHTSRLITVNRLNSYQLSQIITTRLSKTPHIQIIIYISALSNFNPTSDGKGLVSVPYIMLLLTQIRPFISREGSMDARNGKKISEVHPSTYDSSCYSNICSIYFFINH